MSGFEINYLTSYEKGNQQANWSGTTYALLQALKRKAKVTNLDVGLNHIEWVADRVASKTIYRGDYRGLRGRIEDKKCKRLRIQDCNNLYLYGPDIKKKEKNSWVYIDLSVGSLIHFKENYPKEFSVSTFEWMDEKCLLEWNKRQLETFSNIRGIFTMSQWLHDYLVNVEKVPCEVVYAGAGSNCKFQLEKVEKTHTKLLFVGKDFERKGGFLVLEAFSILKKKMPEAQLYVLGGYESKEPIEGVHFVGMADRDTVIHYYNMCDVFCLPSFFEAYGIVFVEALLYGLPVIARNAFEMPYLVEDGKTGRLLQKNDPNELAGYMYELLTEESYQQNVKDNFEFYKKNYTWEIVADRIVEAMKEE